MDSDGAGGFRSPPDAHALSLDVLNLFEAAGGDPEGSPDLPARSVVQSAELL